ncbi:MAG: twin-arginine translocase TatA/TatE family subunit [Acidobacteriota bacterium]|nr:twin-arginine translocase TatA/TatE family subunit [Acidobacteriota bacterium]
MPELLFIMLLALIIFGPAQLPKIGRQLGKALGDFKRASNDFKNQLEDEVNQLELQQMKEEAKRTFSLEPPEGTVAKRSTPPAEPPEPGVEFSELSHDPGWEDPERSIKPPAAPTQPPATPTAPATPPATAEAGPAKPAGDHVG